jgi:diguanylate cyclase (GGDEF)-like protein/PAS domain S-box-containing protein
MESDRFGAHSEAPGRNPGRVRVASTSSSDDVAPMLARSDLLVSGDDDLSSMIADLLGTLRPAVRIHYATPDQLLADDGPLEGESPEAILVALAQLDPASMDWLRRVIAKARLPLIVVTTADPAERSSLRERAREAGAIDCLLREELSSALLEAAIIHARSVNHQTGRMLELRQRYALAVQGSRDGMWEWDLLRDRAYYSQRWCELLGLRNGEVPPTLDGWLSRVHPQDLEHLRGELEAVIEGPATLHESEHRIRDGNDDWRWVMTRAVLHRNQSGQAVRMAGSLTDISPFRQRERALREQSRQDSLTKLPDRRVFIEHCARAVELSRAHSDYVFVVLLIAVDRLGQTRDSFGIDAADQLFALLAKRVRSCMRPEDHLFRFSSSKFAILLDDVEDPSFGTQVAKRIHETVAEPFEFDGISTFTTVSMA